MGYEKLNKYLRVIPKIFFQFNGCALRKIIINLNLVNKFIKLISRFQLYLDLILEMNPVFLST